MGLGVVVVAREVVAIEVEVVLPKAVVQLEVLVVHEVVVQLEVVTLPKTEVELLKAEVTKGGVPKVEVTRGGVPKAEVRTTTWATGHHRGHRRAKGRGPRNSGAGIAAPKTANMPPHAVCVVCAISHYVRNPVIQREIRRAIPLPAEIPLPPESTSKHHRDRAASGTGKRRKEGARQRTRNQGRRTGRARQRKRTSTAL